MVELYSMKFVVAKLWKLAGAQSILFAAVLFFLLFDLCFLLLYLECPKIAIDTIQSSRKYSNDPIQFLKPLLLLKFHRQ